eukprot:4483069-Lingulodinium_polyedra.AAC.1
MSEGEATFEVVRSVASDIFPAYRRQPGADDVEQQLEAVFIKVATMNFCTLEGSKLGPGELFSGKQLALHR